MSDDILYRVKRSLFDDSISVIKATRRREGLDMQAWFKTPQEAYDNFNLREKKEKLLREKRLNNAKVKSKSFMCEFKELLQKHEASVGWYCSDSSDTHGIYDEKMKVTVDCFSFEICEGSEVGAYDINLDK